MNVRWFTTRATVLLLAFAMYAGSTLPKQAYSETPQSSAWPRFGQPIAVSDLDAAGLDDEAELHASGSHKGIAIVLRGAPTLSFLHFLSRVSGQGSLLSQDVDNDGATDLVWTDILRADNVIVWLGDDSVEFEQLTNWKYNGAFTPISANVGAPAESNQEPAINFETYRPLDRAIIQKYVDRAATQLPNEVFDRIAISPPALDQPADRGPPPILS